MPQSCSIEGCEKPLLSRGWCSMHYARWYKHGDPLVAKHKHDRNRVDATQSKVCVQCGATFHPTPRRSHAQWAKQELCSTACANTWRAQQQSPGLKAQRQWATAWEWQRILQDKAELRTWARREHRRQRKVKRATHPLGNPRQFIAGSCPNCGKAVIVVRGWWHDSIYCSACTKKRWRQNHKQRAKMRGVEYEDIEPAIVFARDKRRCQICGKKTRREYPSPTSATIDHITPLSKGGPHLMHNVQTACLRCNVKKHNGAANDQLRLRLPV